MKVVYSPRALRDFTEAADYLIKASPTSARKFADTLDQTIQTLSESPNIGRRASRPMWRVFPLAGFRYNVCYRVQDDMLIIETIFHTSQNPKKV